MLSRELVSKVLKCKIEHVGHSYFPNTISILFNGEKEMKFPNVYELAYKCKEWAYNEKDVILTSWKDRDCCYCEIDDGVMSFSAETEVKAIFQACDWILNNVGSH